MASSCNLKLIQILQFTTPSHATHPIVHTMALQPCRSGLARSRQILRAPVLRACYATDSAPSNDRGNGQATSNTPRWAQTPSQMKAPIQMDFSKKPKNKVWVVNNDPQVLDGMYNRLLGPSGSKLLPEELKFLAVTHKSFDQGRRGFNDRLALLGMFLPGH